MSLNRMYQIYNTFFYAMVPSKPRYGNYRLRGKNERYRKILKNEKKES